MSITIAKNVTASGIEIPDLAGLWIPSYGQVTLTDLLSTVRMSESEDLDILIQNEQIVLNHNSKDLTVQEALNLTEINTYVTFLNLPDTPTTYSGGGGKYPKIKNDEIGIEFVDAPTTAVSGTDLDREVYWVESNGESSTTSDKYQQKISLVFTPHSAGHYEINFSTMYSHSDTGVFCKIRIQVDDSTTKKEMLRELNNFKYEDGAWSPYTGNFVVYLDKSEHYIDMDYCHGDRPKTIYIKEAVIIARRI